MTRNQDRGDMRGDGQHLAHGCLLTSCAPWRREADLGVVGLGNEGAGGIAEGGRGALRVLKQPRNLLGDGCTYL